MKNIFLKVIRKVMITPIEKAFLLYYKLTKPIINNMIVFETEGDFWDNGRAFFEYLVEKNYNEKYQIVWFVHMPKLYPNYKNVRFISRFNFGVNIEAMKVIAQAKCFLFTHPWWLKNRRKGQVSINLTHSTMALKAGGNDVSDSFDYILCASEVAKEIKRITYHASNQQMIIMGAPRNDLLTKKVDYSKLLPKYAGEKIIMSMTTFKQSHGNWLDSNLIDEYCLNVVLDYEQLSKLNEFLRAREAILLVKIHHLQNLDFLKQNNLSNIIYIKDDDLIKSGLQLYEVLGNTQILLTDYSSVFYDFLFLNRPIGFLVSDLEQYKRGFCVEDPISAMPGKKIYDFEQLINFLDESLNGVDEFINERTRLFNEVHFYKSNHCERLLGWLEQNIFTEEC